MFQYSKELSLVEKRHKNFKNIITIQSLCLRPASFLGRKPEIEKI